MEMEKIKDMARDLVNNIEYREWSDETVMDTIKIAKYNERVRKETAREILNELYRFETHSAHPYFTINKIDELAKQFGVDIDNG